MDELPSDTPIALVVDDDPLVRQGSVIILKKAGFRVLGAETGDAAYDLLTEHGSEVTLLFTDVEMPGELDGFALARSVASSWPHISIVVASGHAQPGPGAMPEKARFIPKPFSADLVRAHLKEILPEDQKPEPLK